MPYLPQQILSAYLKFKEILVKYVLNSCEKIIAKNDINNEIVILD